MADITRPNFLFLVDDPKTLYRVVGMCDDLNDMQAKAEQCAAEAVRGGPVYVFSFYGHVQARTSMDWYLPEGIDPPNSGSIDAEYCAPLVEASNV